MIEIISELTQVLYRHIDSLVFGMIVGIIAGKIITWIEKEGIDWRGVIRKALFPFKCIAAVLLSPLLLAAVVAMLVMKCESELLD